MYKKLFVIANIYHMSPRVNMLSYLTDNGWYPTLLTVPVTQETINKLGLNDRFLNNVGIVSSPYNDIFEPVRQIFRLFGINRGESYIESAKQLSRSKSTRNFVNMLAHMAHQVLAYPDTERTWTNQAYRLGRSVLYHNKGYQCILSSSPHPTVHIIASRLQKEFNIPWVADFRDPWTQNHVYNYHKIRLFFERKLELKTMNNAAYFTGATETMTRKQFNLHDKPSKIIYNGFDSDNKIKTELLNEFTISYTGTIMEGKQSPEKLFKVLVKFPQIKLRIYGTKYVFVQDLINKYNLQNRVMLMGRLSRGEILKKQAESHLLWVMNWEDESEKSVCPLKFFEYLGAGRPIIATGGSHGYEIENIINKTKCGTYAVTEEDIENTLKTYLNDYTFKGLKDEIEFYSFRSMAKQFSEVFNEVAIEKDI